MVDRATVHGNMAIATAVFNEAENGDLVDIEFYCNYHSLGATLAWPAYSFPDYNVFCTECGEAINLVEECDGANRPMS